MSTSNPDDRLFTTRWVHLHEQDSAAGEVYAPATTKRHADGRLIHYPGTWKKAGPPGG